jgi:hypothetical protein
MFHGLTNFATSLCWTDLSEVGQAQNPLGHEDQKNVIGLKCYCFFSFVIIFTHSFTPTISLGQNGKNVGVQKNSCNQAEATCTRG